MSCSGSGGGSASCTSIGNVFTVTSGLSVYLSVPRGKPALKQPIFVKDQDTAKQNLVASGEKLQSIA